MEDMFEFAAEHILPHWPFFGWLFLAMLIGQVAKNTLWTKHNAVHKKPHWFWWWNYKAMVLHPVGAGVLLGLLWQNPESADPAWPLVAACTYFAIAGGLSTWAFEFLRNMAKRKADIDLSLPGLSDPPKDDDKA